MSENFVWQDREIRFDVSQNLLSMRSGESQVESLKEIEDTKGNPGEDGSLVITNLRLIWFLNTSSRINLTIGYDCIISIEIKISYNNKSGNVQSLHVKSKFEKSRFEFVFSSSNEQSNKMFNTFQTVCKVYETTKLFRDVKLRAALFDNGSLSMLEGEKMMSSFKNVFNLSADQGNSGPLILTNIRFVWYSSLAPNFNLSIPYIQMKAIKKKDTKFGHSMVVETFAKSGNLVIGFQHEQLDLLLTELNKIFKIYSADPILSKAIKIETGTKSLSDVLVKKYDDDIEIAPSRYNSYSLPSDFLEGKKEIGYNEELGLAMEKLPEGDSIQKLWNIIESK